MVKFPGNGEILASEIRRGHSMKYRISGWAAVGFLVAGCWALYILRASKETPIDPIVYSFIRLTCPIALLRSYPLSVDLVLVANAATYAFVGLIVEPMRRQLKHAS